MVKESVLAAFMILIHLVFSIINHYAIFGRIHAQGQRFPIDMLDCCILIKRCIFFLYCKMLAKEQVEIFCFVLFVLSVTTKKKKNTFKKLGRIFFLVLSFTRVLNTLHDKILSAGMNFDNGKIVSSAK